MTIPKELHGYNNNKDENISNLEEERHPVAAQFPMKGTISVPLLIIHSQKGRSLQSLVLLFIHYLSYIVFLYQMLLQTLWHEKLDMDQQSTAPPSSIPAKSQRQHQKCH